MTTDDAAVRDRILDAFLARLATTRLTDIELADIASGAGITLAELNAHYEGKVALVDAFARRVDGEVLERDDPAMASEPARERLFDVLMRRLDVLAPHREAVRSLHRSVRRDPCLALALSGTMTRSMAFMLAASGIGTGGGMGRLRSHGLALAWARIVPVWLEDTDTGLAKTMVAVDKELARGERLLGLAGKACRRVDDLLARLRPRRNEPPRPEAASAMAGEGI